MMPMIANARFPFLKTLTRCNSYNLFGNDAPMLGSEKKQNQFENIIKFHLCFSAISIAGFALIGSVQTLIIALIFIGSFLLVVTKQVPIFSPIEMKNIYIVFGMFFGVSILEGLFHLDDFGELQQIAMRAPFLGFLPIVSLLALCPREQLLKWFGRGAGIGAIICVVFILYNGTYSNARLSLNAGNPGPLSILAALMFAVSLQQLLNEKDRVFAALVCIGVSASLMCLLLSGMRSMMPVIVIVPMILLVLLYKRSSFKFSQIWPYLFVFSLLFLGALFYFSDIFLKRLDLLFIDLEKITINKEFDNSIGQRIAMWNYGLELIVQSPIIGHGNAQAISGMPIYSVENYGFATKKSHFHNFIIDSLVRGGAVDLISYICLLFVPLVAAFKKIKDKIAMQGFALMLCVLVVYGCAGMFNLAIGHDINDAVFVYVMALSCVVIFGKEGARSRNS